MRPLGLYSERFSPNGNVTAEGVINQLGRPDLDIHSLLIREAVQNSWDARISDRDGIRFSVDGWSPTPAQRAALLGHVFREIPDGLPLSDVLLDHRLSTDDEDYVPALRLLALSDRGTIGLGGPTRADARSMAGEPRDFIDFMRNVGFPPDKPLTGGTYGYGKAASYLASRARTIIVYSRWMSPAGPESRFHPAALGTSHVTSADVARNGLCTGRHWWGVLSDDFVEPVTGDEADELAVAIGLPVMRGNETGTTICMVDPYLVGSGMDETMQFVVSVLLWNFWPKMLAGHRDPAPIEFSASCDGQPLQVSDPRNYPPLDGFVRAFEALETGDDTDDGMAIAQDVKQLRPRRTLGRLSVRKFPVLPRTGAGAVRPPAPFEGPAHHVALMRQVRLVVRYEEGPRLPVDAVQYGGVFIADADLDGIFKASEPPTHDDWKVGFLQTKTDRSVLNVADREIRSVIDRLAAPPDGARTSDGGGSVAGLSSRLAWMLPGLAGPGAEAKDLEPEGPHRQRRPRARVRIVDKRGPILIDGGPAIEVSCQVVHLPGSEGTLVAARARVALDEGVLELDPPADAPAPVVMFWLAPDGTRVIGDRVWVPATDVGVWRVTVGVVPDLMVGVVIEPVSA
jgi:hypothetical protein